MIVLAAAGLMIKSVTQAASRVDPGARRRSNVLTHEHRAAAAGFLRPARPDDVLRRRRSAKSASLPGVRSVAAMSHLPLEGANAGRGFDDRRTPGARPRPMAPSARYRLTCPGYFKTLGIPVTSGRDFTPADTLDAAGVVIINEATASRYWPNQDPVGSAKRGSARRTPWMTVVGVPRTCGTSGSTARRAASMYRPYSQAAWPVMTVTVKTAIEPLTLGAAGPSARWRASIRISRCRASGRWTALRSPSGRRRFPMQLLGLFSVVALALAAIGVYGVVSYVVSQRTREIGIRVALGARAAAGDAAACCGDRSCRSAPGIVAGVAGIARGVAAADGVALWRGARRPAVLGVDCRCCSGASAVAACLMPARRAASVDPLVVLREE